MKHEELLQDYPSERLSAFDGMAVTAAVWEEAHAYHRMQQRFHARYAHSAGILAGLEVVASDPPDTSVYIRPGMAVDPAGHTIVVAEPIAYDLGRSSEGQVYLLVSYGESRPRRTNGQAHENERLYVQTGFSIEASSEPPDDEGVELARVRRSHREAPVTDAADTEQPGNDELDLRFRRTVAPTRSTPVSIGVSYPNETPIDGHGRGVRYLARSLRRHGHWDAWADDDVALDADLDYYTLVYFVAQETFDLTKEELEALYDFVRGGGTVLMESCRHAVDVDAAPGADDAFADVLESMGLHLEPVDADHPLLTEPNLFAARPPGFDDAGAVRVGSGVILSTCDYGCLWRGARRDGPPPREALRAAFEWGENIVAYAVERRKERDAV